jgi:hypothetical protein
LSREWASSLRKAAPERGLREMVEGAMVVVPG